MLVIILSLSEVMIQRWPKERQEKGIEDNDDDKPMRKHCYRGASGNFV
jgi:hypothetical protein